MLPPICASDFACDFASEFALDAASDCAMVVTNPLRAHKQFSASQLQKTVGLIDAPDELLVIVNYIVDPFLSWSCANS